MHLKRISTSAWLMAVALTAGASSAAAQTRADDAAVTLPKGTVEVSVIGGTTLPVSWLRAHADRHLTMGAVSIGRVLTNPIGSGPLSGSFEMLLEAAPAIFIQQPESVFGVAASPFHLRWNFAPIGRSGVRWFAEASGSVIFTSADVPARTTRFNFLDQAGFGLRFPIGGHRVWLAGYRFQHISNAGRVKPNPGVNFNFAYTGIGFGA